MKLLNSNIFASAVMMFDLLLVVLFLGACSGGDSVANGTGSDAGEAELANSIVVTSPSGAPLARGMARLWGMNEDSMELEWSDTLDNDGRLKFASSLSGQHLLESRSGDSLSVMRWVDFGKQPSQTLAAAASVSLKGVITNRGVAVAGATVTILDKSVKTAADGSFAFDALPEGVHYAFVEGDFGKFSYQMQTGLENAGTTNNIDIADSIFTVVEDFEKWSSRQTMLGKSFGEGWWFICTDSLQGGKSSSPNIASKDILVTGAEAKNGSSLHIKFTIDPDFDGGYGVAGFSIGGDFDRSETPAFYDLRKTTAISFDAKGEGEMFLQITRRSDKGEREYHATKGMSLGNEWTHFTFTAKDFGTEFTAVNSLNFVVNKDAEIYLDNIRFDGISPSMWPSLGMDF